MEKIIGLIVFRAIYSKKYVVESLNYFLSKPLLCQSFESRDQAIKYARVLAALYNVPLWII